MKLKHIILSLISFLLLTSNLQAADPWLSSRIEITITPQKPASYRGSDREFLANPVYQQGERAIFNITFRQIQRMWFLGNRYIDIPAINLLAAFPNDKTQVRLKRIAQGRYTYTSPVLTKAGNRNHTLTVAVIKPRDFLNRKIKIIASNKCSISVIQLPLNIQITSPQNGALLNTNPLTVNGTINDNTAVVTVNNTRARVNNNQFTAEINLQEGENQLTAMARNRYGTVKRHTIAVTIDTISPEIQITTTVDGSFSNQHVTDVSGTFIEANLNTIMVNGIEAIIEGGNFTVEDVPLNNEGSNTIIAEISDLVGHTNSQEINVIRDTISPVIEITYPEEGLSTGEAEFTISGTYTEGNMEVITVSGIEATFGEGLFSASGLPLSIIGNNIITVIATDRAGNMSEDSIVIERVLTTEGILESLYNHFNLINDMTADMVVTSTFDGQPFGPPVYARYYYKKINRTKTEFYDTAERENITEIVITDNEMEYFVSPVTRYISQDNLAERAGISQEQFRNMDITSNVEGFIENHTLTQIETEANPEEGIYVIEAVPNTPNQLYSKLKLWIDVNKGLLVISELYRSNRLIETTEILESAEIAPSIWTETRMRNIPELQSGDFVTIMEYGNIQINQRLADSIFDPENL